LIFQNPLIMGNQNHADPGLKKGRRHEEGSDETKPNMTRKGKKWGETRIVIT